MGELNKKRIVKDSAFWYKETIETIKNFTLWDVLPLEETSVIHKIVNEICEK